MLGVQHDAHPHGNLGLDRFGDRSDQKRSIDLTHPGQRPPCLIHDSHRPPMLRLDDSRTDDLRDDHNLGPQVAGVFRMRLDVMATCSSS